MKQVGKLTIEDVLNYETGEQVNAYTFFKKPLDEITEYRSELQKAIQGYREPMFVCYYCKQLIRIRGGNFNSGKRKKDSFHFAHLKDSAACHIKTNNAYTREEVDRIKYNGAKESALHIHLKEQIAAYLNKNRLSNKGVSSVEIEKVVKSKLIEKEWRKPDINASFRDKRVAIELQLSTTWLSVITGRQHFYQEEGSYILWVFHKFSLDDDIRKLTYNDVIFTNHHNAYVFDEECSWKSDLENDLVLKCYYKKYYRQELEIKDTWEMAYVTLSDLTFDVDRYKVYFHDAKKQKREVEQAVAQERNRRDLLEREHKIEAEKRRAAEARILEQRKAEEKRKLAAFTELKENLSELTHKLYGLQQDKDSAERKGQRLQESIENRMQILEDLVAFADKAYDFIAGKSRTNPFHGNFEYGHYEMVHTLRAEFLEDSKELEASFARAGIEKSYWLKKQADLPALELTTIAGVNYHILPGADEYFQLIRPHYAKVRHIPKSAVGTLFEGAELRLVLSETNLLEVFTRSSLYLLVEQNQDVLTYTDQVEASQKSILLVNHKILNLKAQLQERARQILEAEIANFELEKSENRRISEGSDVEIAILQAEVTRLKSAMDDFRETF
ncbi:hypothetical protein I0P70_00585 [Pontibacter sp. FD36]|uniref:Competence protein CoiA-like family protein n=1 Tax=Pontibacter amylolyticus TaxID=1424080 RepID=A0ABQ1W7C8_9BACT|nr:MULTISPECIES: DUF6035 family protein [Pontibacter]MBF8961724.1 hypothetical protein [Pontibacter sp. FD36]GGG18715.1 hypothetical protein GCM10011323_23590 [Pontibacter amylolyticus]